MPDVRYTFNEIGPPPIKLAIEAGNDDNPALITANGVPILSFTRDGTIRRCNLRGDHLALIAGIAVDTPCQDHGARVAIR